MYEQHERYVLLTDESGTGKTALLRALADQPQTLLPWLDEAHALPEETMDEVAGEERGGGRLCEQGLSALFERAKGAPGLILPMYRAILSRALQEPSPRLPLAGRRPVDHARRAASRSAAVSMVSSAQSLT